VRAAGAAAARLTLAAGVPAWPGIRWPAIFDQLMLDRDAVLAGQVWRLWTGHLMHLDLRHAAVNLAALALLALIAARMRALPLLLGGSLLLMPAISLGLLLCVPDLQWYAGLSGLLHAWTAWLLVRKGGVAAVAGLALLAAKLAWETALSLTSMGIPVVLEAHRIGALAGLVLAGIAQARTSRAGDACRP